MKTSFVRTVLLLIGLSLAVTAQGEPQKHEPNAKQGAEGTEPKKEFHDAKNVIEEPQDQALCSFSSPV